jgi:hypothetical protein
MGCAISAEDKAAEQRTARKVAMSKRQTRSLPLRSAIRISGSSTPGASTSEKQPTHQSLPLIGFAPNVATPYVSANVDGATAVSNNAHLKLSTAHADVLAPVATHGSCPREATPPSPAATPTAGLLFATDDQRFDCGSGSDAGNVAPPSVRATQPHRCAARRSSDAVHMLANPVQAMTDASRSSVGARELSVSEVMARADSPESASLFACTAEQPSGSSALEALASHARALPEVAAPTMVEMVFEDFDHGADSE